MMIVNKKLISETLCWLIFSWSVILTSSAQAEVSNLAASDVIPVEVGIRIHQIVDINEKKKNFTAVLSVKAKWNEP